MKLSAGRPGSFDGIDYAHAVWHFSLLSRQQYNVNCGVNVNRPRILLLSAYDAGSHRYWRQWLEATLTDYSWTSLPLPDRHFFWRVRSNALTYYSRYHDTLAGDYDLIIATSMTDLSTLRGLVPALASCPSLVYFHENQFAYPISHGQQQKSNIINAQLNSILTAVAADVLVFNSTYNYTSFFCGLQTFVRKMPDGIDRSTIDELESKAATLPVPVETPGEHERASDTEIRHIVWNHRWEYDKQPEVFFDAIMAIEQRGAPFRLHVMGQSFRNVPVCFAEARLKLAHRIETWGYQTREKYFEVLDRADIVVSTAAHDFQGLGMIEAIARGCVPVAPDRVAYPEYVPAELLFDTDREVETLASLLYALVTGDLPKVPPVTRYLESTLAVEYKDLINKTLNRSSMARIH